MNDRFCAGWHRDDTSAYNEYFNTDGSKATPLFDVVVSDAAFGAKRPVDGPVFAYR